MQLSSLRAAPTSAPIPNERAVVDGFRTDRLLEQVTRLGGPRVTGTPAAKRAAELIRDTAAVNGWDARIEHVPAAEAPGGRDLYNVVADWKGTAPDGERRLVLAGAHLDSARGAPGANDDATGVAALLEGTRVFAQLPTKHDLRFLWFDGEEAGLLGSRAYARRHADEVKGAAGMVVAEMLGSPKGSSKLVFMDRAMSVSAKPVTDAAARNDVASEVVIDSMAASDHLPFVRLGVPSMVVATTTPRTIGREDPNYHRPTDTPDRLNPTVLEQAGDLFGLAVNAYANA